MSDSKIEVVCNYCKRSSIVALDAKVSKCGNCGAYTELDLTAYIGDEGKKVEQPVKKVLPRSRCNRTCRKNGWTAYEYF